MTEFLQMIEENSQPEKLHPEQMNALVLAYIGDTIYDLFIRTWLIDHYHENAHSLHIRAIQFVKAESQSKTIETVFDILTEEEQAVYRRGRNSKAATVPKNASVGDYHRATGFEALLGYLYLTKQYERLLFLLHKTMEGKEG